MKPAFFAVQSTGVRDAEIQKTVAALRAINADFALFGLPSNSNEVSNLADFPENRVVIPFGTNKLKDLWHAGHLPPNWLMFYNRPQFDQQHWRMLIDRDKLVNPFPDFYKFSLIDTHAFDYDVFIKPALDTKSFAGFVMPAGSTLRQELLRRPHRHLTPNDQIMVGTPKQIDAEYRLIMVDGRAVTASRYASGGQPADQEVALSEYDLLSQFAAYLGPLPGIPVYALDVARMENRLYVMEVTCINTCGMYSADRAKVYSALHNYVGAR